jgi:hypothetical protein
MIFVSVSSETAVSGQIARCKASLVSSAPLQEVVAQLGK